MGFDFSEISAVEMFNFFQFLIVVLLLLFKERKENPLNIEYSVIGLPAGHLASLQL